MFKKLIIAAFSASLVASAAFADSTNIGIRLSAATMAATGSETQDSAGADNGGDTTLHKEQTADFALPSIFVERQFDLGGDGFSISLGLDYVPFEADVDTLRDPTGANTGPGATINAGNLFTAYIQPTFAVNDNLSFFGKAGYAQGDLDITSVTQQATAVQANDNLSTDVGKKSTLEGPMYGIGMQLNNVSSMISFIRVEATITDFDEITHTNSNGKILKADAEMNLYTLSIGKSF